MVKKVAKNHKSVRRIVLNIVKIVVQHFLKILLSIHYLKFMGSVKFGVIKLQIFFALTPPKIK